MLAPSRRCSALLARTLSSAAIAPRAQRASLSLLTSPLYGSRAVVAPVTARYLHGTSRTQREAVATSSEPAAEEDESGHEAEVEGLSSSGPIETFSQLGDRGLAHPNVITAITQDMGIDGMTEVQAATIQGALKGTDIIAQAKTGTGKTLAFLLPVLQDILKRNPSLGDKAHPNARPRALVTDIRALIISPTRELAEQIATEARKLTRRTSVVVQAAVGGTQKRAMLQDLQRFGCHILVGTPGRLHDILSDRSTGVSAPSLNSLVLDEADRLLDDGFWPDIERIMGLLPNQQQQPRQTLMFSATIPREVIHIVRKTLQPGFQFVKTVKDDEEPTHNRVPQNVVIVRGLENLLPTLYELCLKADRSRQGEGNPLKAIVYFNATAMVSYASSTFRFLRGVDRQNWMQNTEVYEIHAKLTQEQRTRAAEYFKKSTSAILFSSDVTARGMDFPNVTHVIQVGVPSTRETYIHRIGRTARAGKEGQGWLILTDMEMREARDRLHSLPLSEASLETARVDMTKEAQLPENTSTILDSIDRAVKMVNREVKVKVYRACLGVFGWARDKQSVVDKLNDLIKYSWGWDSPPSMSPSIMTKLGYGKVTGVNTSGDRDFNDDGADSRGEYRSQSRYGQDSNFSRGSSRYSSDRPSPRGFNRGSGKKPYPDFNRRGKTANWDRVDRGERRGGRDDSDGGYGRRSSRESRTEY